MLRTVKMSPFELFVSYFECTATLENPSRTRISLASKRTILPALLTSHFRVKVEVIFGYRFRIWAALGLGGIAAKNEK